MSFEQISHILNVSVVYFEPEIDDFTKRVTFASGNFHEEKKRQNLKNKLSQMKKFLLKVSEINFRVYRSNCKLCRKNFRDKK